MESRGRQVVVTGGAGYLGANVVLSLKASGWHVTVVDDLSTGYRPYTRFCDQFVRMDIRDRSGLTALLSRLKPEAVIHLAGRHRLEPSFQEPEVCAEVNLGGTASLLSAMRAARVGRIILAGDLCVYGNPGIDLVTEEATKAPISPLGRTLLATESLLEDARRAFPLIPVSLRVASLGGSNAELTAGEAQPPFWRLVVRLARAAIRSDPASPFVMPWTTTDGRWLHPQTVDIVHVSDAADAFVRVLEKLKADTDLPPCFNVSSGNPISVDQLVQLAKVVCGREVPAIRGALPRGEVPRLVADNHRLVEWTGWRPHRSSPDAVIASALAWEHSRRDRGERISRKV